jgi:hypothetical protein
MSGAQPTLDDFFAGQDASRRIFDALRAMVDAIGPAELRVTKSQVAFRRHRSFASAWMPSMYLRGERPPLVLTLALRYHDASPRWKQIVEPAPGRFTHHLELGSPDDLDDEVRAWLQAAWEGAGEALADPGHQAEVVQP